MQAVAKGCSTSLNLLPTFFLFPLEKPVPLFPSLGMFLDTPRSDEEIKAVVGYLKKWQGAHGPRRKIPKKWEKVKMFTEVDALEILADQDEPDYEYLKSFLKTQGSRGMGEKLARMWIMIRFEDKGIRKNYQKQVKAIRRSGNIGGIILNEDDPLLVLPKQALALSHLLSLLAKIGPGTFGSFAFDEDIGKSGMAEDIPFFKAVTFLMLNSGSLRNNLPPELPFWPAQKGELIETAGLIEKAMKGGRSEELFYIAELLLIAHQNKFNNEKLSLVVLTSILEFLLTHNPDIARFNVEDSINRQFQFKGALVRYLNGADASGLEKMRQELREAYSKRSQIVHGNFKTGKSRAEGDEQLLGKVIPYVRDAVRVFLKNPDLIRFLKNA